MSGTVTGSRAQLGALLDDELLLLSELIEIMQQEQTELLQGLPLEELLARKQAQLLALEQATGRRMDWLRNLGVSPDRVGMLSVINQLQPGDELVVRYGEFEALAATCRNRNDNLALIARRRENFASRVLASLQLNEDATQPTYSPAGDVKAGNSARLLGSA